jgi:hypothetical protein
MLVIALGRPRPGLCPRLAQMRFAYDGYPMCSILSTCSAAARPASIAPSK